MLKCFLHYLFFVSNLLVIRDILPRASAAIMAMRALWIYLVFRFSCYFNCFRFRKAPFVSSDFNLSFLPRDCSMNKNGDIADVREPRSARANCARQPSRSMASGTTASLASGTPYSARATPAE